MCMFIYIYIDIYNFEWTIHRSIFLKYLIEIYPYELSANFLHTCNG
jgi:hypothetical protein